MNKLIFDKEDMLKKIPKEDREAFRHFNIELNRAQILFLKEMKKWKNTKVILLNTRRKNNEDKENKC